MIASSDVELKRLVDRGEFSSNLYHWLSKSVIRVPSLNSRKEDIALLAGHIIEELADVLVLLEQIKIYYELDNDDINSVMEHKINRTLERLKDK